MPDFLHNGGNRRFFKGGHVMKLFGLIVASVFLLLVSWNGTVCYSAEAYPARPINFIVPNEAGADADVLARPLCQRVSAILGKPVVIVNKPGGGSSIGMREVHESKPDGYTIGMAHATILINKLIGNLPYDHEGFTVLGTYATFIPIVVGSTKTSRPFKTLPEAVAFGKANPGEVSIATSGVGQSWWVATLAFQEGVGVNFNIIPQPGTGAFSVAQVAGGHTDLAILALAAAKSQIDADMVKFLSVFGSKKAPGYENVPTMKELGIDVSWESTQILLGPPKMPAPIVEKLVKAFETAANEPEYKKFVIERNAVPFYQPPAQAVAFFNEQRKVVRSVMKKAKLLK
jgi:tripartite-type tricarboxylate transporter receptor subunit TctC